jgi:hypothetical protein
MYTLGHTLTEASIASLRLHLWVTVWAALMTSAEVRNLLANLLTPRMEGEGGAGHLTAGLWPAGGSRPSSRRGPAPGSSRLLLTRTALSPSEGLEADRPPGGMTGAGSTGGRPGSGAHWRAPASWPAAARKAQSARKIRRQSSHGGPGGGWSSWWTTVGRRCPQRAWSTPSGWSPSLTSRCTV